MTGSGPASPSRNGIVSRKPSVAVEQKPARLEPQEDQPAGDQAERIRGQDQPPRGRAAEVLLRDRRSEHALDAELDRVDEPELEHDHPQPRARAELAPAVLQLRKEVRRLHPQRLGQPDRGQERGGDEERGGVDRNPDPGLVAATTSPPIAAPLIQLAFWPRRRIAFAGCRSRCSDGLRNDSACSREEERRAQPVDCAEHHQLPDLGVAAQEEDRDQALRRAADHVRENHHPVARKPVGPDSAGQQEDHRRERAGREDEAEVGLRAGQVEDGERERDVRERVADERSRSAEEEEAEVAPAERACAEPVNQWSRGGSNP